MVTEIRTVSAVQRMYRLERVMRKRSDVMEMFYVLIRMWDF